MRMGFARWILPWLAIAWPCRAAIHTISSADPDAALRSALTSAAAGDTLRFPPGRYVIARTIAPGKAMVFAGDSATPAVLEWRGDVAPMIELKGVDGVEIRHLAFQGGAARNAISAFDGIGLRFHHLRISGFTDTAGMIVGIHCTGKVESSLIADNVFSDMAVKAEFGGAIRLGAGCRHNRILRNVVERAGRGGIHLSASPGNVIRGNRISGSGYAQGGANPGLGIEVWGGCDSSLIEDNSLDHWLSVDGSPFTAVRRNRIGAADGTYKAAGLELVSSSHCVFTGNRVEDGAHIGISISNKPAKDEVYWARDTIAKASTWAMQMQGEEQGASYHFFYGNTFAATPANHPQALYAGQGHALRFHGNCYHVTFDSNTVTGNGGAAIDFGGPLEDFTFTRNVFQGNGRLLTGPFPGTVLAWQGGSIVPAATTPSPKGIPRVPRAHFAAPGTARAGETVRFANASLDAEGRPMREGARVLWDFDDGLPSNRFDGEHAYAEAGVYRVALVVWEEGGQGARMERTLVVGSASAVRPGGTGRRPWPAPAPAGRHRRDARGRLDRSTAMPHFPFP
jgi:parallel beta-helix repeat protein